MREFLSLHPARIVLRRVNHTAGIRWRVQHGTFGLWLNGSIQLLWCDFEVLFGPADHSYGGALEQSDHIDVGCPTGRRNDHLLGLCAYVHTLGQGQIGNAVSFSNGIRPSWNA